MTFDGSCKYRVLLLEGIHHVAKDELESAGFEVELLPKALPSKELIAKAQGFHALGIRSKTQLREDVISELKDLLVIGAFCIGTNQVDLSVANSAGVPVFNAPYANTRSVAELVIAELVALARKLGDINSKAHKGVWSKSAQGSYEVRGKTLGIVGYGHIGSQLSILAEAMGFKVLFYDIVKKLPLGNARSVDSLDSLLSQSDFVSFHVPETSMTKGMMNQQAFQSMKQGAHLVNASRGTVIEIPALVEALKSGRVAGAAIDVFPKEPRSNDDPFTSELQGLNNVILTPHIGGSTEEAQENIGDEVAESLKRFLLGGSTFGAVNFPNIDVPPVVETRRLINVHRNVPGVLGEINSMVSDMGVNIRRQFLSTDSSIGYLTMDMELEDAKQVGDRIRKLPTSIKTRIV